MRSCAHERRGRGWLSGICGSFVRGRQYTYANVEERPLREIVRTNDPVLVTAIEALFNGADIPHMVLDRNMSVLEGSLGILPRRILVSEDHAVAARQLLHDAGLGHELRADKT
jgi:hypothetical protein